MIELKEQLLATTSAKMTPIVGSSTMVMAYFQSNAAGIGALCTLITLIFYIFFQYLADKKTNQSIQNKQTIKNLEEIIKSNKKRIKNLEKITSDKLDKG